MPLRTRDSVPQTTSYPAAGAPNALCHRSPQDSFLSRLRQAEFEEIGIVEEMKEEGEQEEEAAAEAETELRVFLLCNKQIFCDLRQTLEAELYKMK
ncbi:MAG: hypothetical protein M1830_009851 [Pleopsidium flavum]|nr:MAG: hypothetical protein M1830_009851 [Pleopsidium flavum]